MSSATQMISPSPSRPWRWIVIVAALGGAVAVAILFAFDPSQNGFYPRCVLHALTGLDCPGCGGLRAAHQLLHGNFREAVRLNPLLVGGLPVFVFLATGWIFPSLAVRQPWKAANSGRLAYMIAFVVIAFGIVRNLR